MENQIMEEKKNGVAVEPMLEPGNACSPDVDIVEDENRVILYLDLPGVAAGGVNVEVDEHLVLKVRAHNAFIEPKGEATRQFGVTGYFRAFQLGEDLNRDQINAKLENGVLTLTIPKREEVKPRRIEIKA